MVRGRYRKSLNASRSLRSTSPKSFPAPLCERYWCVLKATANTCSFSFSYCFLSFLSFLSFVSSFLLLASTVRMTFFTSSSSSSFRFPSSSFGFLLFLQFPFLSLASSSNFSFLPLLLLLILVLLLLLLRVLFHWPPPTCLVAPSYFGHLPPLLLLLLSAS